MILWIQINSDVHEDYNFYIFRIFTKHKSFRQNGPIMIKQQWNILWLISIITHNIYTLYTQIVWRVRPVSVTSCVPSHWLLHLYRNECLEDRKKNNATLKYNLFVDHSAHHEEKKEVPASIEHKVATRNNSVQLNYDDINWCWHMKWMLRYNAIENAGTLDVPNRKWLCVCAC